MLERLEHIVKRYNELEQEMGSAEVLSDPKALQKIAQERASIEPIVDKCKALKEVLKQINDTQQMLEDNIDDDLKKMAEAEIEELETGVAQTVKRISKAASCMQTLTEQAQKNSKSLNQLEEEAKGVQQSISQVGVVVARHSTDADNVRSSLAAVQNRCDKLSAERSELEEHLASAQSQIGGMADDDETLKRKLQEASENAAKERDTTAALSAQVSDLRVKQAESMHALEELRRGRERAGRARNDMLEQAEKQQQLAVEMEARAVAFEEQVKETVHQSHRA